MNVRSKVIILLAATAVLFYVVGYSIGRLPVTITLYEVHQQHIAAEPFYQKTFYPDGVWWDFTSELFIEVDR